MWIRVRSMDGRSSLIEGLSKLTKIEDLRERLMEQFNVVPGRQRLLYGGMQVASSYLYMI